MLAREQLHLILHRLVASGGDSALLAISRKLAGAD